MLKPEGRLQDCRAGSSSPGKKRGVFGRIRRELRRRSAIEAVIGHCKTDRHLGRNFLHGRLGDRINAVMSAVGYNPRSSRGQALRLILKWFRELLRKIIAAGFTFQVQHLS